MVENISEQEKKDQEDGIDKIANQITESDKQEKKNETQIIKSIIYVPK